MNDGRSAFPLGPVTLGARNDATGALHFSADECQLIHHLAAAVATQAGSVGPGVISPAVRDVTVAPLVPSAANAWVVERVVRAAAAANQLVWAYDIRGVGEPAQYLTYRAPSGGYRWHHDLGRGDARSRKLSVVVQLSSGLEYEGGDLEFFRGDDPPRRAPRELGSVTVFPAFLWHRVTPVAAGVRRSLAVWIDGPPLV